MDDMTEADRYLESGCGDKALPILRRLAESGRLGAIHALAHSHLYGVAGIPLDYDVAFTWFSKGADGGCPQCMYHLGMCNLNGYGTPTDPCKALEWYAKAAARGDEDAMYEVGNCYAKGIGTDPDVAQARRWYEKAAERGQREAAACLECLDAE